MKKILAMVVAALMAVTVWSGLAACNRKSAAQLSVYMPDGAPALALAQLMYEDKAIDNVTLEYNVVAAEAINAQVTGDNPAADLCILPVNAAAKLLGSGEKYKMLGTVTHGNLFLLSSKTAETVTQSGLTTLKGKTVGVVNLANVPGLTMKMILADNGVPYNEVGADADSVYLKAIDSAAVGTLSDVDYYVVPEPAASTKASAIADLEFVGNLQSLYGGENGYPQAVLVAKNEVVELNGSSFVRAFMEAVSGNFNWLQSAEATGATLYDTISARLPQGAMPSMNAVQLDNKTILANCSIRFVGAAECKGEVKEFIDKLISINPQMASAPSDAFFYEV